jgi:tRNA wybutosine-synthesizing protein 2
LSRASAKKDSLAARVNRIDADATLKKIISCGLLDKRRKVLERGDYVEIPVTGPVGGCDIIQQDQPSFYRSTPDLADALKDELPPEVIDLLPRGWYIMGDVIAVKMHHDLTPYQFRIGQALLDFYPRCKTVLRDWGIEGQLREPRREIVAGASTKTVHKENGVLFALDTGKVMFSPGNLRERMRMSRFGQGEFVVDMFAGIGYFSLQMAVHSRPRKVLSIELNPVAFEYLRQNISLNHVEEIVEPVLGDCAMVTPQGVADRVVMGMVQVTNKYLQTGISALRPGGILHYHQTIPTKSFPDAAVQDVMDAAQSLGKRAEILKCIKVKKYSPGVVHCVIDARINQQETHF